MHIQPKSTSLTIDFGDFYQQLRRYKAQAMLNGEDFNISEFVRQCTQEALAARVGQPAHRGAQTFVIRLHEPVARALKNASRDSGQKPEDIIATALTQTFEMQEGV